MCSAELIWRSRRTNGVIALMAEGESGGATKRAYSPPNAPVQLRAVGAICALQQATRRS